MSRILAVVLVLFTVLLVFSSGCVSQTESLNTTERTVVQVDPGANQTITPANLSIYHYNGFGEWTYGDGVPLTVRDDLAGGMNASGEGTELLSFATISDIHITDEESPLQVIALGYLRPFPSAYSPVSMYSTQVLNAAVKTINNINKENQLDLVLSLGDAANNDQYNELRWYIDVLDGKTITPVSGGTAGKENIDYQKTFTAEGLDMPWYQTIGNHDEFFTGVFAMDENLSSVLIGDTVANLRLDVTVTGDTSLTGYYLGVFNGSDPNGTIIDMGSVSSFASAPTVIADANRHAISDDGVRIGFMQEFLNSSSLPYGHGYTEEMITNDFACYSFDPMEGVRIIMLDDTTENGSTIGDIWAHGRGSLDEERFAWLKAELQKGREDGVLMIIGAHIPIATMEEGAPSGWSLKSEVSQTELITELQKYPNLLMWVSGHNHMNTILPIASPDPAHPEYGFWVVETASLRDFPQEFRTFEITRYSDELVGIKTVCVDVDVEGDPLAEKSRSYSIAVAQMSGKTDVGIENAELLVRVK
ncbi:TIGR03768 family metallophosphoesterase [uncultured Methanocorpusculum sp.]|nr:TIGR03768 family metallophosphoesterase [uncultured Methanocorpusculum sp.]